MKSGRVRWSIGRHALAPVHSPVPVVGIAIHCEAINSEAPKRLFCEFSHRMCHNLLNVCGKAEREVLNSGGGGVGIAS
jgi:hypothetical protein